MGPITLFDKSFLQSLSLDEAIWFDAFFYPVVCPIFYVETLANLAKVYDDRTAEDAVGGLAERTPELCGSPVVFHGEAAMHNLLGFSFEMDGRILRPGGRHVEGGGRTGVIYDEAPEERAFSRWKARRFLEVERSFASQWRATLQNANLAGVASGLRAIGIDNKACKSLQQAMEMAEVAVNGTDKPYERLKIAVQFFEVPQRLHSQVIERWQRMGCPTLSVLAPYSAFVLKVEIFFHIALAADLLSASKVSNRTDISYLHYLPFCTLFVSSDNLHRRAAPLFMRKDQQFVWGPDLKADLARLNQHFLSLPEVERDKGVLRLSRHPPVAGDFYVTRLWKVGGLTAEFGAPDLVDAVPEERSKKIVEELSAFTKGRTLSPGEIPLVESDKETISIERRVRHRKGSWYLLPKELEAQKKE